MSTDRSELLQKVLHRIMLEADRGKYPWDGKIENLPDPRELNGFTLAQAVEKLEDSLQRFDAVTCETFRRFL